MMRNMIAIVAAVFALLIYSSVFVVEEAQRGIVIQFGKVKKEAGTDQARIYGPGLQFKVPLIDSVRLLDARIQTMDDEADRFVTSEKKDLIVDSYVKWRINDFARYYLATGGGNLLQAEALLKRKVNNALRSEFGNRTVNEIVSGERGEMMKKALENAIGEENELGIEVVDVRVKQINLPAAVSTSIFQRMRAERNAVAKRHRAEGEEAAESIRAKADREVTELLAAAERKALTLRGEGDATAARIFADAFNDNPEFYSFVRSLEAYRNSFQTKDDVLVIEPDSDFFRYMKDPLGGKK